MPEYQLNSNVDKVRQIWEKAAKTLTEEAVFIPIPPNFRTLNLEELQREGLLPDLIKAYQEVFGSEDIWGEGAFCDKEGWNKLISTQEYNEREKEGKLKCECGGTFIPCHFSDALEERIAKELSSEKSVLAIMERSGECKIGGFAWGVMASFPEITKRTLLNPRHQGQERKTQVTVELSELKSKLEKQGIVDETILFVDELGVVKESREGVQPHILLLRLMTEWGSAQGTRRILFWTSKDSPIYQLGLGYGGESIHRTKNGLVFMLHTDFGPVLKVAQHFTEEKLKKLIGEVMEELFN